MQKAVAKVISTELFVMTDLATALKRARARLGLPAPGAGDASCPGNDYAGSDDGDDDEGHVTCAYATRLVLVPDMLVSSVSGQVPQLLQLLRAAYCNACNGDALAASPLAFRFESFSCSLRCSVKLRRRSVCSRLLPVIPERMVSSVH